MISQRPNSRYVKAPPRGVVRCPLSPQVEVHDNRTVLTWTGKAIAGTFPELLMFGWAGIAVAIGLLIIFAPHSFNNISSLLGIALVAVIGSCFFLLREWAKAMMHTFLSTLEIDHDSGTCSAAVTVTKTSTVRESIPLADAVFVLEDIATPHIRTTRSLAIRMGRIEYAVAIGFDDEELIERAYELCELFRRVPFEPASET